MSTVNIEDMNKTQLTEAMYNKKIWNINVLTEGGLSYYTIGKGMFLSDGSPYKTKYRVAMTNSYPNSDEVLHEKKLKWRVRTADGEIFSVASKTCAEAQYVVDLLFGTGHYKVSQMLN